MSLKASKKVEKLFFMVSRKGLQVYSLNHIKMLKNKEW